MKFRFAMLSSPGGRSYNQDTCHYVQVSTKQHVWITADGLGGHGGGEVASREACQAIHSALISQETISSDILSGAIDSANQAIVKQQKSVLALKDMRTTLVALGISGESMFWAHVGDSRLLHLRDGSFFSRTRDHSVPQRLADAGEISHDDIRHHEDRNRLLRSLGKEGQLKMDVYDSPTPVQPGDVFLLSTDGFWEYLSDAEIEVDLSKAVSPSDWLSRMEQRLLDCVDGEHDNYTAQAIFVYDN